MMDNLKALEMIHNYFEMIAAQVGDTDVARREAYNKYRKIIEKFLIFYEKNFDGTKYEIDETTGFKSPTKPFPETTGIDELKEYESAIMPILEDFYKRAIQPDEVREKFEGALFKLREGWEKKLQMLKQLG